MVRPMMVEGGGQLASFDMKYAPPRQHEDEEEDILHELQ